MSKHVIGAQIKAIRIALGISQDAFAMLFNEGVDPTIATTREDIAKYELGINAIPAHKYVRFLELDPDLVFNQVSKLAPSNESKEEVDALLKDAGVPGSDSRDLLKGL